MGIHCLGNLKLSIKMKNGIRIRIKMFQIHFVSCNITLETDLFIKNVLTFFFIDYDKIFENDESQHVIKKCYLKFLKAWRTFTLNKFVTVFLSYGDF